MAHNFKLTRREFGVTTAAVAFTFGGDCRNSLAAGPAASTPTIDIRTVAPASAEKPRHGAPTIIELKDGRLLLAWMEYVGGKLAGHDHAHCNIASMISSDGGRTWSDYRVLVHNDPADTNIHFPYFLRLKNGDILFYYLVRNYLAPGEQARSSGMVCFSKDEGKTFSKPVRHETLSALGGNGRILSRLSCGRIILPAQRYQNGVWGGPLDHQVAGCYYSDDEGQSWEAATQWVDLPMRGAMEPHIVQLQDGSLLMTLRTQLGAVFQSTSSDGGTTWSLAQTTGLVAPESMPCLTKIPQTGDLLMIYNKSLYHPHYDHYGKRTPLTSAISRDEGRSWEKFKNIESDPNFEFTNPACFFVADDRVLIGYETSQMAKVEPPGRFGRTRMPMKMASAHYRWFYE